MIVSVVCLGLMMASDISLDVVLRSFAVYFVVYDAMLRRLFFNACVFSCV
ncbi:hypothetical protein HanOQP8_Chr17g0672991 [Helianthus annuus]|nr:hypothetical protein HanLR1_Chr17g0678201 [Helianthus annuus]KAJ0637368.1 hypothetical protein HanOQP8_Chr17g0672991 [Helianthus annuus]